MNKNTIFWIVIVFLILIGIYIPVFFKEKTKTAVPSSTNSTSLSESPATLGTIVINGFNYGFSPKTITVKQGEMVKIKLVSDDSPHTFTVDELGVDQQFTYGKDASVSFTASKKGTFQFYCAVPSHKENGMVGTLIVQ